MAVTLAVTLTGCGTTGVLGGGKPTEVKCKGKGAVVSGTLSFQADCGDGFEFSVNVQ